MSKLYVTQAKNCPLRYSDDNGQFCVLQDNGAICEGYADAYPSNCPILDDDIFITRKARRNDDES